MALVHRCFIMAHDYQEQLKLPDSLAAKSRSKKEIIFMFTRYKESLKKSKCIFPRNSFIYCVWQKTVDNIKLWRMVALRIKKKKKCPELRVCSVNSGGVNSLWCKCQQNPLLSKLLYKLDKVEASLVRNQVKILKTKKYVHSFHHAYKDWALDKPVWKWHIWGYLSYRVEYMIFSLI